MNAPALIATLDEIDRRIVVATQGGLPLVSQPYHAVAKQVGISPAEVMARIDRMLAAGMIRRIGAVPNHYALGYRANGMTVWNVRDSMVEQLGERIGRLPFVSHCYLRPRHPPRWPYNLFAMLHGRVRSELDQQVAEIAATLGEHNLGHAVLVSTRILKKTGLRLTP